MNPIKAAQQIEKRLQNYIRMTLPVDRSMPQPFTAKLDAFYGDYHLAQDPFLELMPAYAPGSSLQELSDENVIHPRTAQIFADAFLGGSAAQPADPARFKLYAHQTESIRKVCGTNHGGGAFHQAGMNLVVCSGTGSGKTEAFLIPLVDYLVRQWDAAGQQAVWDARGGVRAMLLYPMNALVNDQIRRLRQILQHAPFIRFGKYTGELDQISEEQDLSQAFVNDLPAHITALQPKDGVKWSGAGFDDEAGLPNEIHQRSVWQNNPGHILVTNYSMLEHMLLKPDNDAVFGNTWKFIILDEAHCYTGAVGTEIAWLIRRLQRRLSENQGFQPNQLRFLATSATLFDDPTLSPDQQQTEIKSRFASKVFPASADSFHVQFGVPAEQQSPTGATIHANPLAPDVHAGLLGAQVTDEEQQALHNNLGGLLADQDAQKHNLFELSELLLGLERWTEHLKRVRETLARLQLPAGQPIAAGDAHYLLQTVQDTVAAELVAIQNPAHLQGNFLDANSLPKLQSLVRFLQAGVGPTGPAGLNAWRDILHDDSDPGPSNYPNDLIFPNNNQQPNANPRPNPRGNRLRTLLEWESITQGNLGALTVEGFSWLLAASVDLAVSVEQETGNIINPRDLPVTFSATTLNALAGFAADLTTKTQVVAAVRATLNGAWLRVLSAQNLLGQNPHPAKFESLLALALGGDPRLAALAHFLGGMPKAVKAASDHFYPNNPPCHEPLLNLISLASMGVAAGGRRPLLDIRYHQLLRGIDRLGLVFNQPPNGGLDFSLTASRAEEEAGANATRRPVFDLGVCRDCGQPFVLGYAVVRDLRQDNQAVRLRRERSDTHSYLHAFAWQAGSAPDDPEEDPQVPDNQNPAPNINQVFVYFNMETGQVQSSGAGPQPAGVGWVAAHWYLSSHTGQNGREHPEFISSCPCCHTQHNADGRRFGVVTPYTAEGAQFRVVALDELTRLSEPSSDPSARKKPGMGRKVLAFSDSRRSSASLAFGYQSFFLDSNLPRFLCDAGGLAAAGANAQNVLANRFVDRLHQAIILANPLLQQMHAGMQIPWLQLGLNQYFQERPLVPFQALALAIVLEQQHNCGRLLEISDQNGQDLPDQDAAAVLVLRALVRKGRYSLLGRGMVRIESKHITSPAVQCQLDALAGNLQRPAAALNDICHQIYQYLFQTAKLNTVANWPQDGINQYRFGEKKQIRQNNANNCIRFVTQGGQSKLNQIVRQGLGLNNVNAGQVLGHLWPVFAPVGLPGNQQGPLVPVDGGAYEINLNDLKFTFVAGANLAGAAVGGGQQPPPHERENLEQMTRDVIPVRIEEHTAQISTGKAAAYQRGFTVGSINIISCSTTFEMGVDLGDLATVFLANLPPGTANYRQRAGRAGRRPGASAYVLTFMSGSSHDDYFSDLGRTTGLLFGRMNPPQIYLENFTYRARHLRAEALHKFLAWAKAGNRLNVVANGANLVRKWNSAGQFFKGMKVGKGQPQPQPPGCPVRSIFDPVVQLLVQWHVAEQQTVQDYLNGIDGATNLDYSVAADLVWQLLDQPDNQANLIAPYPVAQEEAYRMLGGPKIPQPAGAPISNRRSNVQSQFLGRFNSQNANAPQNTVTMTAAHLLRETTIEWLARTRVLPRYGFPVDVIQLLPHPDDRFARNVKLERDLKLGLYEYAPGQTVIADKRMFRSNRFVRFDRPGVLGQANNAAQQLHICSRCHEVYRDQPPNNQCPLCTPNVNAPAIINAITVVEPDAFQADRSTALAGQQTHEPRGTAQNIYTGGLRGQSRNVSDMSLATAESASGTIGYVNQGNDFNGYDGGVSLYHEVHTDIAVWLPEIALFQQGGPLTQLNHPAGFLAAERLRLAMLSALEAILHEAAQQLEVSPQDIGGLLHPHPLADGINAWGFVLFDASPGGGGTVLPLVLSGDPPTDARRHKLIYDICLKARDRCRSCPECGAIHGAAIPNPALAPLTRENFEANPNGQYRRRQSCYRCLRSYQNQRKHDLMDRFDAAVVLNALLHNPGPAPGGGGAAIQPPQPLMDLPPGYEFDLTSCPGIQGGPHHFRRLAQGEAPNPGKYVVRLDNGQFVLGRLNPNINPWNFSYNNGTNQHCSVTPGQVCARLIP